MFDQILEMVKDHMGGNAQVAQAVPQNQQDDVNNEIASHIDSGLKSEAASQGGVGGLLSQLSGALQSGNPVVNAIQGGLVGSLGSKFGLPPAATGAIAAALPGILQKFAHKANDPNDHSLTPDSISNALGGGSIGNVLGGLFK